VNWNAGGTASAAMRTTATSTSKLRGRTARDGGDDRLSGAETQAPGKPEQERRGGLGSGNFWDTASRGTNKPVLKSPTAA